MLCLPVYYYYYYYYKCHGLECCQSGALYKNLDLKLLHSSLKTSADYRSRWRHVSRMIESDKKRWDLVSLRNVKSEEQARVSSGRLFHARAAATGKARSPRVARQVDGTYSVVVSAERRHRRPTISDACGGIRTRMDLKYCIHCVPKSSTRNSWLYLCQFKIL